LELSWSAILKVTTVFFAAYLVYLIHNILVLSVFGLIISILFEAPIRLLEKKVPRTLAIAFLYIFIFSIISFLIYLPASRIVTEAKNFIKLFPLYFEQFSPALRGLGIEAFKSLDAFIQTLESIALTTTSNIFNVFFNIFGGITSTIYVISIAVFFSLEGKSIENALILFFSEKDKRFINNLWRKCEKKVGFWFLKTMLGCLFISIATFISLLVLRANYPFSLAIIGGAFNFVPVIGPVLASLLIFVVLAFDSLPKAIIGLLIYFIVQQIENNIVSPMLSKKLTGLSPTLVLISLAAGGKLFGILGAILTVPLIGIIVEFAKGILERRREEAGVAAEIEEVQKV